MLSAFIMGLAFGGLWIKRRIDKIADPVRFSGYVQLIMGVMALLTVPIYMSSYDWMSWVIGVLQKNDGGFVAFSTASHLIALAIMLPTTFMAGMTLPLFTHVLIQKGEGESSIGRIYAANTIGAIVGVLFAVHIGFSFFGLKNLVIFGAALDIVLAVVLLQRAGTATVGKRRAVRVTAATMIGVGAIVLVASTVDFDEHVLVSGVYRHGSANIAANDEMLFYRDGKTASVSLRRVQDGSYSLATNGKVDAAIQMDPSLPATHDEITMTLLAALPLAYSPDARRVANIGLGSGQTTHVLLANPRIEAVDTVEIEVEMVNASREFGAKVARAHEDPRSRIFIEDAKTYFSLHNKVYDVIVAEPSNPWVSGVASLFSTEFYGTIPQYLAEDGIFVQWIQLYEFSDSLLESILKALAENFDDFVIYSTITGDVVLIARKNGALEDPDYDFLQEGNLREALRRVEINSNADLKIRKIIERSSLESYLELSGTPTNSDYYPFVDLNAGHARYMGGFATAFNEWTEAPLPVLELLTGETIELSKVTTNSHWDRNVAIKIARALDEKSDNETLSDPNVADDLGLDRFGFFLDWVKLSEVDCLRDTNTTRWRDAVFELLRIVLPNLESARAVAFVDRLHAGECAATTSEDARNWRKLYTSIASRDAASISANARRLLIRDVELNSQRRDYLLMAAMLGDIANDKATNAYATWQRHGASRFSGSALPATLKLLVSLSAGAATPAVERRSTGN
ncbi:MAG: hypothetical protein HKP32_04605, partial [Woeseia sp.]|nr:hypothetical protein [Woeseia sp.]